jgi:hypothetical protein
MTGPGHPKPGALRFKGSDGTWIGANPGDALYSSVSIAATEFWCADAQGWRPIFPPEPVDVEGPAELAPKPAEGLEFNSAGVLSSVSMGSGVAFRFHAPGEGTVFEILRNGDLRWRGRLIESDAELREAMIALSQWMVGGVAP